MVSLIWLFQIITVLKALAVKFTVVMLIVFICNVTRNIKVIPCHHSKIYKQIDIDEINEID